MQTEARVGVVVESGGQIMRRQQYQALKDQQSQIGAAAHLISGGVAGAFSKTCTAPLGRLTILFQMNLTKLLRLVDLQFGRGTNGFFDAIFARAFLMCMRHLKTFVILVVRARALTTLEDVQGMHSDIATLRKTNIWREASRIIHEEGFRAFWKGNFVMIVHRLPYSSINFYAFEQYKKLFQFLPGLDKNGDGSAHVGVRFLSGGLSGITASTMTYPLDLVRTRLAAQTNTMYYKGISHALIAICRDEGARGLYKGLGASLLVVGPNLAINFSVYETLRSHWQVKRPNDSSTLVSLACGGLSGIASSTVTFPLDLVRRRKQLEGSAGRARVYKTGIIGTFRHVIKAEGFRGLYRGIWPEYYKVVPGMGIAFMTYETMKSILSSAM